jgi:hypothetical protein
MGSVFRIRGRGGAGAKAPISTGTRRLDRRAIVALTLTFALTGCAGAAATSSPSLAAVSPTSTVTAVPTQTVVPQPTLTSDDTKIAGIIKDGVAQMVTYGTAIQDPSKTVADLLAVEQQMNQFAAGQIAITSVYTASSCTAQAWMQYKLGVTAIKAYTDQVIAWAQGGSVGAMPAVTQDSGFYAIGQAVAALNSSPCFASALTATPTPIPPEPTFTADDTKIAGLINAGLAKLEALTAAMGSTLATAVSVGKMQTFANAQIALRATYSASACTTSAWGTYQQGMTKVTAGTALWAKWFRTGAKGAEPTNDIASGAQLVASSATQLSASTCPVP